MKSLTASVRLAAALLGLSAMTAPAAQAKGPAPKGPRKVLFFTKSSGYEHGVIKEKEGAPSFAATVMKELANKQGFDLTVSKDGAELRPEGLKSYDAFVFYTTGDLTQPGNDKNPRMPDKQAFLDAIKGGKGFVGVHSATDTFHSGPDVWKDDGDAVDPFIKMLGGEFISHGDQQEGKLFCVDPKFPGLAACKGEVALTDEFYSLKNLGKDLHVLMWLGTWSLKNTGNNSVYRRAPYPVTWARMEGKGRVFYTALGHREDVWTNPTFQEMLVGGIRWAAGDARADVKPNVAQVTPGYREFPPHDPKPITTAAAKAPVVAPVAPPLPPVPARTTAK